MLSDDDLDKPFAINRTTGLVYTTKQLDYEDFPLYTLIVQGIIEFCSVFGLKSAISGLVNNSRKFC